MSGNSSGSNSGRSLRTAKNNSSSTPSVSSKKSFHSVNNSGSNKIEGALRFNNVNTMSNVNKVINLYPGKNKLSFLHLLALMLTIFLVVYIVVAVINYFKPIKFLPKSYFFPRPDDSY